MIKKILLLVAALAFTSSSFALTASEEAEFTERVANMPMQGRLTLIAVNTVTSVAACGFGGLFSTFSLAADTVPAAAKIQQAFTKASNEENEYEYTGGLGALVTDLVSFVLDISDAEMDEALFEELPKAYDETEVALEAAFNDETGYCSKQTKQLVILLGLRNILSPEKNNN